MSNQAPPGWYPDPEDASHQRYWDGTTWTDHRTPAAPQGGQWGRPQQPQQPQYGGQPGQAQWTPSGPAAPGHVPLREQHLDHRRRARRAQHQVGQPRLGREPALQHRDRALQQSFDGLDLGRGRGI